MAIINNLIEAIASIKEMLETASPREKEALIYSLVLMSRQNDPAAKQVLAFLEGGKHEA